MFFCIKMNGGTFVLALYLLFLGCFVQCHDGVKFNPLQNLLSPKRLLRRSVNSVISDEYQESDEYKPIYIGDQDGLKGADKILSLPGQPIVNFDQYSGYVTIDPNAGRALFYYFAESENPTTKPLVLWFNGGPGCSSIGNGALMELGPFRVNPDGKTLWLNKYAWNKVANIIFLESPAGVGFSYSNRSSDYVTGDEQTATDSYTFLVNWLERFPEYKTRDLFIAGESYAGHYVPQLTKLILHNNKITNQTIINLKGIAIGNPYIDYETQHTGVFDYLWTHALMSDELHSKCVSACNFSSKSSTSDACQIYTDQTYSERGKIFDYDIYAPLCHQSSDALLNYSKQISEFDPCTDKYISAYLNTPEVQESLHATVPKWESCNKLMNFNWLEEPESLLPVIKELMSSEVRVWLYSGDTDPNVPVTTTQYAIKKLEVPVETPWYAWYSKGEVGGYVVGYQNLTFVTIRGSGHFTPSYQPARTLDVFSSFLNGQLPPSSPN